MANKLYTEIAKFTTAEITSKIEEAGEALLRLNLDHAVSAIEDPLALRNSRREIARLKTELRSRELVEGGVELAAKRDRIRLRRKLNK